MRDGLPFAHFKLAVVNVAKTCDELDPVFQRQVWSPLKLSQIACDQYQPLTDGMGRYTYIALINEGSFFFKK
jgi:hypothetical protein